MLCNDKDAIYIVCLNLLTSINRLIYIVIIMRTSFIVLVLGWFISFNIDCSMLQLSSLLAYGS